MCSIPVFRKHVPLGARQTEKDWGVNFHLILAIRCPRVGLLSSHSHADWLPMVKARELGGLNY